MSWPVDMAPRDGAEDLAEQLATARADGLAIAGMPAEDRGTPGHGARVAVRLADLRADREARAILAAEGHDEQPLDAGTLAELLRRPAEPAARVEGLIGWQASTLLVAQRKVGKTTAVLNLARCVLTGEQFLGGHGVRPLSTGARVGFLNFEVSGGQLARWASEAGLPADRLFLVNLRGRRNPLANPVDRARLAGLLRAQRVEMLIVDPFGRAYSGASQNDAGEVYGWLVQLDQFARAEVGALDLVLTTHAGWDGERSRGSSALEDWADVIITMTRDKDTGERFIRATGRDVALDEDRLDYDPDSRTLTLAGVGGRRTAAAVRRQVDLADAVVALLERMAGVGMKVGEIANQLRVDGYSFQRGDVGKAAKAAAEDGRLTCEQGKRRALIYSVVPSGPEWSPGIVVSGPDPSYRDGTTQGPLKASSGPNAICPTCSGPNGADRNAAGLSCLTCRGPQARAEHP